MAKNGFGLPSSVCLSHRALIRTKLTNVGGFSFAVCSIIGWTDNLSVPHFKLGLISGLQRRLQLTIELLVGECDATFGSSSRAQLLATTKDRKKLVLWLYPLCKVRHRPNSFKIDFISWREHPRFWLLCYDGANT